MLKQAGLAGSAALTWRRRLVLAGSILATSGQAALAAGGLDPRFNGAWLEAPSDCPTIFAYKNGVWSFRKPVSPFGPGYIFSGGRIQATSGVCRVLSASTTADGTKVGLECATSVSYERRVVRVKLQDNDTLEYFFEGNATMSQIYKRCPR